MDTEGEGGDITLERGRGGCTYSPPPQPFYRWIMFNCQNTTATLTLHLSYFLYASKGNLTLYFPQHRRPSLNWRFASK
jgi:hypothetical protein